MFNRAHLVSILLAGGLALPASADGFDGVAWTKPALMVEADGWKTNCPARCVVYQGDDDRDQETWPLVVVHQPVTGPIPSFYAQWKAAIEKDDDNNVTAFGNEVSELSGGAKLHAYFAYTEDEGPTSGRDTSMLLVYELQGVAVPVEIKSFYKGEVNDRLDEASAILESIRLDVTKARAAIDGNEADLASKRAAIDKGYTAGGKARLYMQSRIEMGTRYGLGGLEIAADRITTVYALLPGGVLLTGLPDDLRKPDLMRLKADGVVGTWTKTGAGYDLGLPDGKRASATLNKMGELVIGGETYPLVDPLTSREMPGRYETIAVSTSGGMAVGNPTMIATRFDGSLVLKPDGTFEQGRESYVSISGPNIGGGTGSDGLVTGKWMFDPAAYMLTLKPTDGTPQTSGLFFCYFCDAATITDENWDWNVLGGKNWWRKNKDN